MKIENKMKIRFGYLLCGPQRVLGFANNKEADQPSHLCSLVSAFVICLLQSITVKPANTDTPWDHRKNPVFTVCRRVKTKGLVTMENC